MRRPRRAAFAAAVPFVLLLAACGGGDATQGSVQDDVEETLLESGRVDDEGVATEIAACVSVGLFSDGEFTEDERNDVTRAVDGDDPDPELVTDVEDLVDGCFTEAGVDPSTPPTDGEGEE